MRILANPVMMRAGVVLAAAVFSFIVAVFFMRRMRQSLTEDTIGKDAPTSIDTLPLHTYHAVIQQLKQQKHELQSEQAMERRRAKTSENISGAILSNLSSGVLFFTANGLIRQANAAAKEILGYASPLGMSAAELFRDASLHAHDHDTRSLADEVQVSLREKSTLRRMEAHYLTPAGDERILDITLTAVPSSTGEFLGAACLINDRTELAQIRRQQDLRGEMSAEMALELRNSLTTIAGYAQQLAASDDHDLARQLATDISAEAAHLDHTIGGFLAAAKAKAAAQN